ncbi:MAG: hypothetical protein JNL82_23950 [Myxococcales bacterium]|nr:hypothetical protein [Myxococcales bacterium]
MISFSDPHQTLVGLHDMLTGWRSIRERRRMRSSPPTAAASPVPPVSMHSPPVGAPPGPGPAAPERATVIAYRKLGDRIVPIFGDPAESDAAQASANGAPSPSEARAAEAPAPQTPPQAAPDVTSEPSAPKRSPQTPPPPDFTPQAVEASSPRRGPAAPPTLDLPPPTPPSLVRADEQAATLERVLADHRVQLARQTEAQQVQHAATMEAILAEHRRAQAQADHEHRQQLGELLAKHREEVQTVAQSTGEHGQALVNLRELLAEQASATQAEHARIGEKIESIVDIVGMVGETVHHIAAAALQPKAPLFGALPTRPVDMAAKGVTDQPMQAPPKPAVNGAARVLPVRPPVQQASPTVAAVATVQPVEQAAPPTVVPHVAAPQPTVTGASPVVEQASPPAPDVMATRPRLAAVSTRGEPDPTPPTHQVPPTERVATPSAGGSTSSRSPSFTPAAAVILTLTSPQTTTPTPRQLRAEAAARERSRLDDAVSDLTLDDTTEPDDEPDANEAPNV